MNILFRPAAVEDAAEIARVRVTTWRAAYHGLIDQDYLDRMAIEAETQKYKDGLSAPDPDRVFYVAEITPVGEQNSPGRPLAGYGIAGPARDEDPEFPAELYALYILPEYQGRGIGRSLVYKAVDWLIAKNYQTMIIYVLRENAPARLFYEAIGGRLVREKTRGELGLTLNEVGYGYTLSEVKTGSAG